jgi:hypothetical protein
LKSRSLVLVLVGCGAKASSHYCAPYCTLQTRCSKQVIL